MVEVGTGTRGTKYLKTNWPIEEGLVAGTTKQSGRKTVLEPEEKDLTEEIYREGL